MGNELITRNQLQSDLENLYNNKISPYLNGATHTGFTPIGTVIDFLGTTAPSHYLECDGSIYNIADYSDLANYFETTYGSKNYFGGNGTITFAVPTITGDGDIIKCICAINNFIDYALDGFPVAVTNPQDKQGLTFDATTQKWVNGAGGLHEYSTTEKVVGTWIDGRPIYEITIPPFALSQNTDSNWHYYNTNLPSSFDKTIKIEALTTGWGSGNTYCAMPIVGWSNYVEFTILVVGPEDNTHLGDLCIMTKYDRHNIVLTATIQYVKTTDTPTQS